VVEHQEIHDVAVDLMVGASHLPVIHPSEVEMVQENLVDSGHLVFVVEMQVGRPQQIVASERKWVTATHWSQQENAEALESGQDLPVLVSREHLNEGCEVGFHLAETWPLVNFAEINVTLGSRTNSEKPQTALVPFVGAFCESIWFIVHPTRAGDYSRSRSIALISFASRCDG
jgi:hypothetical protein